MQRTCEKVLFICSNKLVICSNILLICLNKLTICFNKLPICLNINYSEKVLFCISSAGLRRIGPDWSIGHRDLQSASV